MIEYSETLKELPKALVKLQSEINNPTKNKYVDMKLKSGRSLNYGYVELGELISELREPMAMHGFCIINSPYNDGNILGVEGILLHASGEYIKGKFGSVFDGNNAQEVGSQITYFRRYLLLCLLGLAQEDDDGIQASKNRFASDIDQSNQKPSDKQLNAMYYKVQEFKCDLLVFNEIIKPNINVKTYKWLMDNFTLDNFNKVVSKLKG